MSDSFRASILGIPHIPSIVQINVRSGPGTNFDILFKAQVGTADLPIRQVKPDDQRRSLNGKTYQWFQLEFPNGQIGWARDDLLEVVGQGEAFGYPRLARPMLAFNLMRQAISTSDEQIADDEPDPDVAEAEDTSNGTKAEPAMAQAMGKSGLNIRSGPGIHHIPIGRMNYLDRAPIKDAQPGDDRGVYRWVKLEYGGKTGWAREDFLRLSGQFEQYGLGFEDQYPAPVRQTWWVRGFNLDNNRGIVHWGWDQGGNIGEPILVGPKGGRVVASRFCRNCGSEGASTLDRGIRSLSDSRVLNDPDWNFGYGHYVIMCYENHLLPESTRGRLGEKNMGGAHLYVMYAHLSQSFVRDGQMLGANQPLGALGNSGNSSGPHLHLEVRAGMNPQESNWSRLHAGLQHPGILFLR